MSEATTPTHISDVSDEEFLGSLNGYDEIAIVEAFGGTIGAIADKALTNYYRGLIFVDRRRRGDNHAEAKDFAMKLPIREALAYFPDAEPDATDEGTPLDDDPDLDVPLSAEGNDDVRPVTPLTTSPTSVSALASLPTSTTA